MDPSTTTADRAMVIELWDASTCKPRRSGSTAHSVGSGRNLVLFTGWLVAEFGVAEARRVMLWSTQDLDRLTSDAFGESTAPSRRGPRALKKGVATESAHAWNQYGGSFANGR